MKLYLNGKRNVHWWVSNIHKLCLLLVMWGSALTLSESLLDNLFSVKSMDCNRFIRDTQQPAVFVNILSNEVGWSWWQKTDWWQRQRVLQLSLGEDECRYFNRNAPGSATPGIGDDTLRGLIHVRPKMPLWIIKRLTLYDFWSSLKENSTGSNWWLNHKTILTLFFLLLWLCLSFKHNEF